MSQCNLYKLITVNQSFVDPNNSCPAFVMCRIFTAVVVFLLIVQVHQASSASDEELRRVFEMMKTESETKLQNMQENAKKATRNQVLSILVLSDTEITDLNLIPTERFEVLINRKPSDIRQRVRVEEYFTNKDKVEVHGEIIALYIEDTITNLLNEFDRSKSREIPNVLVYSHYIPCANVPNIPYSCAEEIGKAATYFSTRSQMYVAFSDIFEFTDAPAAIDFLLNSRIQSVINLVSNQLPVPSPKQKTTGYFQQELFNCLLNKVTGCRDNTDKEAFVAYQVNDFTKTCTQRTCSKFYGKISTLGLNCLGHCLIGQEWVPCCKKPAQADRFGKAVGDCIKDIHDLQESSVSLQFGMPRTHNLVDKVWTPINNIDITLWRDVFRRVTDPGGVGETLKQTDITCSEGAAFTGRANEHRLGKLLRGVSEYAKMRQKQRQKGGPTIQN